MQYAILPIRRYYYLTGFFISLFHDPQLQFKSFLTINMLTNCRLYRLLSCSKCYELCFVTLFFWRCVKIICLQLCCCTLIYFNDVQQVVFSIRNEMQQSLFRYIREMKKKKHNGWLLYNNRHV